MKKVATPKSPSQAGRGKGFEEVLALGHKHYRRTRQAVVQKVPTPTTVMRRKQPDGSTEITGAFHAKKSTVDFLGVLRDGRAVAFEAKSNQRKTMWPFDSIHQHQVDFLRDVADLGGLAFVLVEHLPDQAVYLIPAAEMARRYEEAAWRQGRASIPAAELRQFARVPSSPGVPVDWLAAVQKLLRKEPSS